MAAVSAQVTPRAGPPEKSTPHAFGREAGSSVLTPNVVMNPNVVFNPNFDFAVRHQSSTVFKSFNEDASQQFDPISASHRMSPAAATADSSRRQRTVSSAGKRAPAHVLYGSQIVGNRMDESSRFRQHQSHSVWSSVDSGLAGAFWVDFSRQFFC